MNTDSNSDFVDALFGMMAFTATATTDNDCACNYVYDNLKYHHPERAGWVVPKKLICAPRIRKHRKAEARAWKTLQSRRAKHKR